jgi:hypothetical protein
MVIAILVAVAGISTANVLNRFEAIDSGVKNCEDIAILISEVSRFKV